MRRTTAALLAVGIAGCGSPPPHLHNPGTTIVCFGDSITAGVGRGDAPSYPDLLEGALGVPVVNAGRPGDTSGSALQRLDTLSGLDPWLVIIELGGNDILRRIPVETTEANLRRIVEHVLGLEAVPLLIEVHGPFGGRYEDVFDRLEDRYGVPVLRQVLPDILIDPSLKADNVHPNAEGYRRLADAVARQVRPLLEARRQ